MEIGIDEVERIGGGDFAVEAAVTSCVASTCADLIDVEDEGILVAVGADFANFLDVSGGGAFVPDFLAGAGPVDGFAFFESELEGSGVHVGEHERLARFGVDGESGDEAVLIEFGGEGEFFFDFLLGGAWGERCVHGGRMPRRGGTAKRENGVMG